MQEGGGGGRFGYGGVYKDVAAQFEEFKELTKYSRNSQKNFDIRLIHITLFIGSTVVKKTMRSRFIFSS
jgi:hypothetical protein